MNRRWVQLLWTISLLIVSCQPELVLVDVTRIVEVAASEEPDVIETAAAGVAPRQRIEVTRLVSEEVTRVITSTVVETQTVEVTRDAPGTAGRPIQILFSATAKPAALMERGQLLADALGQKTGLQFEIGVLDDEETVVGLMCSAPADTMGILPAAGYLRANKTCDAQVGGVAVHEDGLTWEAGMLVTRRDSGIDSIEDLVGARWAISNPGSLGQQLYFQDLLDEAGVALGEVVEYSSDSSAMLAVYSGEVDVASAAFVPPILPYEERLWEYGVDSPEIWRRTGISPSRSPIGYVLVNGEPQFGGYRVRDARAGVFDIAPGIFDETRILAISAPIPNETLALGAQFPLGVARSVVKAIEELATSPECDASLCAAEFAGWTGFTAADGAIYAPLYALVELLD